MGSKTQKFLIHYHEIALKGKNRPFFEKKLIENIRKKVEVIRWRKDMTRFIIEVREDENADDKLAKVFGIEKFAEVKELDTPKKSIEHLKEFFSDFLSSAGLPKGEPVRIRVKRADKTFPLTSPEIERELGSVVVSQGYRIDLRNPKHEFFIEIAERIYLYSSSDVREGAGGLPVSTSGKALCMLSGGIDSPVASYLVMKRGMHTDFIHFHAFPENSAVFGSKILKLISKLHEYLPDPTRVFLVPYYHFQLNFAGTGKYELVLFKRFMLRVSEAIAEKFGYDAVVTGESLAQVASQTIHNLKVIYHNSRVLSLHPLIGMDKKEIIQLAKKIGTYDISIQEYKDCCSIVSKHPATKAKISVVEKIEDEKNMEEVVKRTLDDTEYFIFPPPSSPPDDYNAPYQSPRCAGFSSTNTLKLYGLSMTQNLSSS